MDELNDLTPDEVRASLRAYFAGGSALEQVRVNRDSADDSTSGAVGFDAESWRVLAEQLGLAGLIAPAVWGGLGLSVDHAIAAVEECGAALCPGPVRASVLLARSLTGLRPDAMPADITDQIDGVLDGRVIVGMSVRAGESAPRFDDGRVTGLLEAVTDGPAAQLLLAEVTTAGGPALALVAVDAGALRTRVRSVDFVTPLADVDLVDAPAVLLTEPGDQAALQRYRTFAALLLAAEQVGVAEGALAQMVEYAGVREQFGTPIGAYQAIANRCAATAVDITAARSLVGTGAAAVGRGDDAAAEQLSLLARAEAADAANAASASFIQVSGGIGFTWEHDAHLYFRRARATASIGGTPSRLRDRAVELGCLELLTA